MAINLSVDSALASVRLMSGCTAMFNIIERTRQSLPVGKDFNIAIADTISTFNALGPRVNSITAATAWIIDLLGPMLTQRNISTSYMISTVDQVTQAPAYDLDIKIMDITDQVLAMNVNKAPGVIACDTLAQAAAQAILFDVTLPFLNVQDINIGLLNMHSLEVDAEGQASSRNDDAYDDVCCYANTFTANYVCLWSTCWVRSAIL